VRLPREVHRPIAGLDSAVSPQASGACGESRLLGSRRQRSGGGVVGFAQTWVDDPEMGKWPCRGGANQGLSNDPTYNGFGISVPWFVVAESNHRGWAARRSSERLLTADQANGPVLHRFGNRGEIGWWTHVKGGNQLAQCAI